MFFLLFSMSLKGTIGRKVRNYFLVAPASLLFGTLKSIAEDRPGSADLFERHIGDPRTRNYLADAVSRRRDVTPGWWQNIRDMYCELRFE